jgi:hypothetical protein
MKMLKLLRQYLSNPTSGTRERLQAYLDRHPFATLTAPDAADILRAHGFRV